MTLKSSEKRKGQYLIIEQMFVFGIGIMIAFSFLATFSDFERNIKSDSAAKQLRTYGRVVSYKIMDLTESGGEAKLDFEVPSELGGESYILKLSNGVVIRTASNRSLYRTSLLGLENHLDTSGKIFSGMGEVTARYDGKSRITLGGA